MTIAEIFADVEGALRTWLRAHPVVGPLVGNKHVFFGVPPGDPLPLPMIIVERIGGSPVGGDVQLDTANVSFSVWAKTKDSASRVERAVCQALVSMGSEALDANTVGYGASVFSRVWLPDPDSNTPRYVVTALVTNRAGPLKPA